MKLTNVEKKEKNQVALSVTVAPEAFEAACEKAYRKNVHSINIQGFRRGKAPRKIIEKMYGKEIFYEDAMNECIPAAYEEAVKEAGLAVVSQPSITKADVEEGELRFVAEVYVKPEVEVRDYKGLEAERMDDAVTPEEVGAELDRMLQRNARQVAVDRAAQKGDVVNLDFEGFVDGVAFDGGKGEKFDLELGSGSFIPGFEDQLEGKAAGEETEVSVTFPEDYHEKTLAGKPAVFKCKIHEVKEQQKPALDDEFAKDVSEFDTLEQLKADLEAKLKESKKARADSSFRELLMDKVIATMEGDIPDAMVETQVDRNEEDFNYRLAMQGMNLESYLRMSGMDRNTFRTAMAPQALRQVKIRLALEKIAQLEKLEVTQEELDAEFSKLAENNKLDLARVKELLPEEDLKSDLLCQKADEFVMANAKALPVQPAEQPKEKPAKKTGEKKTAAKKTAKKAEAPAEAKAEEGAEEKKPARKPRKKAVKKEEEPAAEAPAEKE